MVITAPVKGRALSAERLSSPFANARVQHGSIWLLFNPGRRIQVTQSCTEFCVPRTASLRLGVSYPC